MKKIIVLFTILSSCPIQSGYFARLYIWQVGQGQWVTRITDNRCTHYDMGGEKAPLAQIQSSCANKKNDLYLSHSDLDHIKFMAWGAARLPTLCLHLWPREELNTKKTNLMRQLPLCSFEIQDSVTHEIEFSIESHETNELSRVHWIDSAINKILIPGDSTTAAEKIWAQQPQPAVSTLILGHHGSRTSTGEFMLNQYFNLKQAVSSARMRRYGHPHKEVVSRLKKHGVATLRTEFWGNIIFEL